MGVVTGDELLRRPVRLHGIELGRPVDVLVDREGRALGLEVVCRDGRHRFLPLGAAEVRDDEISLGSALLLLEGDELAFYHRKAEGLGALRGTAVVRGGEEVGALADVVLAEDGAIEAVVVEDARGTRIVPYDDSMHLGAARRKLPAA